MKNKIIYGMIGLGLLFAACDDFLKEDSGDLLIPQSVLEYTALLYGEGYPVSFDTDVRWIVMMTDDVEMNYFERDAEESTLYDQFYDGTFEENSLWAYYWDELIEGGITDNNYGARYGNILGCNLIIDALPEMEYDETQTGKYNALASQAYALRAYNYFCLVNLYAKPWSQANLNELGVIIRTSPQVDTKARERSTIGEVWNLINSDLKLAQEYAAISEPSANPYIISPAAIQLLATRVALFQENWATVISIGEAFLTDNPSILNLNSRTEEEMGTGTYSQFCMFNINDNAEIIFTFGGTGTVCGYLQEYEMNNRGHRTSFSYVGSLLKSYQEDDLRKLAYFKKDIFVPGYPGWYPDSWDHNYAYPIKFKTGATNNNRENWRTVEVYLNVAEAYARSSSGVNEKAITLLNRLRFNRIRTAAYADLTVADFQNQQELVSFIWEERRRELCFEECMRWWDLRRQGMPRLVHDFYHDPITIERYVLPQGSPNYVLSIPRSETDNNFVVTNNPREKLNPVY